MSKAAAVPERWGALGAAIADAQRARAVRAREVLKTLTESKMLFSSRLLFFLCIEVNSIGTLHARAVRAREEGLDS